MGPSRVEVMRKARDMRVDRQTQESVARFLALRRGDKVGPPVKIDTIPVASPYKDDPRGIRQADGSYTPWSEASRVVERASDFTPAKKKR